VSGRTFHGAVTRLALIADVGGRAINLSADVPSRVAGALAESATVGVYVSPDHVRLFPI
jgi:hypothetical protein